jgi:hypothetical protein
MAHAKEGSTQVSHSTAIRCLLQMYEIMALSGGRTSVMTHERPLSHVIVPWLRFSHIRGRELCTHELFAHYMCI